MKIESILCAIDLSEGSRDVLAWAGIFASRFNAQLTVLHAEWWEPPPYFTQGQVEVLAEQLGLQADSARDQTRLLAEQVLASGLAYDVKVVQGHAIEVIQAQLEAEPPDLLVLGSHGRTGVSRMMLGSVAENVIRQSRVLSLVARTRGGARKRPDVQRIVVPVDFGDSSREALVLASEVAAKLAARLFVFRSAEEGASVSATRNELCDWLPGDAARNCEIEEVVRVGSADEQIVHLAKEIDADLIVMTSEHRPFLEWSTIGTTTERVMRHSPCSVLIRPSISTSWLPAP